MSPIFVQFGAMERAYFPAKVMLRRLRQQYPSDLSTDRAALMGATCRGSADDEQRRVAEALLGDLGHRLLAVVSERVHLLADVAAQLGEAQHPVVAVVSSPCEAVEEGCREGAVVLGRVLLRELLRVR